MNTDFLPVEDKTCPLQMANHEKAVKLGLSKPAGAGIVRKVVCRPGINPVNLPTKKGQERVWPHVITRHHSVMFERFEDHRVVFQTREAHEVINGAPNAYHPYDQNALGQIAEQQARGFCSLVKNEAGELIRQTQGDPCPGYLVSKTAYQHPGFNPGDPRRYLNALQVPYVTVPVEMMLEYKDHWPKVLGSTCVVRDRTRGHYTFTAVVGDVDTTGIGGISRKMWETLRMGREDPVFEFQVFAGVAFEGFELQSWKL